VRDAEREWLRKPDKTPELKAEGREIIRRVDSAISKLKSGAPLDDSETALVAAHRGLLAVA
jgi:hypothetical protein